MKIVLDSHVCTCSYLILKSKNVVKFYVHISPIFSCRVTNVNSHLATESLANWQDLTIVSSSMFRIGVSENNISSHSYREVHVAALVS